MNKLIVTFLLTILICLIFDLTEILPRAEFDRQWKNYAEDNKFTLVSTIVWYHDVQNVTLNSAESSGWVAFLESRYKLPDTIEYSYCQTTISQHTSNNYTETSLLLSPYPVGSVLNQYLYNGCIDCCYLTATFPPSSKLKDQNWIVTMVLVNFGILFSVCICVACVVYCYRRKEQQYCERQEDYLRVGLMV